MVVISITTIFFNSWCFRSSHLASGASSFTLQNRTPGHENSGPHKAWLEAELGLLNPTPWRGSLLLGFWKSIHSRSRLNSRNSQLPDVHFNFDRFCKPRAMSIWPTCELTPEWIHVFSLLVLRQRLILVYLPSPGWKPEWLGADSWDRRYPSLRVGTTQGPCSFNHLIWTCYWYLP